MEFNLVDESNYEAEMTGTVLPALAACCEEGWFDPSEAERAAGLKPLNGLKAGDVVVDTPGAVAAGNEHEGQLHYLCYNAAKFDGQLQAGAQAAFRGAIVISHGFTEFAEKYTEMVWYFLLAGYSVCTFDHRGHGKSLRDVTNKTDVWIDDWNRYVVDLGAFAENVGREYAQDQPLHLYCHSMGGGIGAAALERFPSLFDKAVLSAPMIAPQTGMPNWIARALSETFCTIGLGRKRVFGHGEFPSVFTKEGSEEASDARLRWYYKLRNENAEYQTYSATFEWVRQSLRLSRSVLKDEACSEIETPILLFQAGRDIWVLNEPQNRFITKVQDGGCEAEIVRYNDSLHEIFSMPNDVLEPYLERIFEFYRDPALM